MDSAGKLMLAAPILSWWKGLCFCRGEKRGNRDPCGPGQGLVDLCCFEKYFRNENHVLLSE